MPRRENPAATPLDGPVAPQKAESGNGNGLGIRHDGFVDVAGRGRPLIDQARELGIEVPNPVSRQRLFQIIQRARLRREKGTSRTQNIERARTHAKKERVSERRCAYHECGEKFVPKRPNQFYHSENCRKFAHQHRLRDTGDAAARLVSALEAVSAAPDQLGELVFSREGVDGKSSPERAMWAKLLQLADRADSALKFWKSQVDLRSKK